MSAESVPVLSAEEERVECATCRTSVLLRNWANHVQGKRHQGKVDPHPSWITTLGVRHGVIDYDDQDEWLTESDLEGASRIVARDVADWFGRLVVTPRLLRWAGRRVL
jgi:hypothetical protein